MDHTGDLNKAVNIDHSDSKHNYSNRAKDNLWMHFTQMGSYAAGEEVPIIVKGEGPYIFDHQGKRYLDGISSLFATQIGHGRQEMVDAYASQAKEIAYFPNWSYANPTAIELAEKLASMAPGDLNHVFFSASGSESVETAAKLIKQYWKMAGKPMKHKIISRYLAYHGTTAGALSITGIPAAKEYFEPLVPGHFKVTNTNFYRAPENLRHSREEFGIYAANRIEEMILLEGPDTVAALFIEPVQNAGGCFIPPDGYLKRVREICDEYDVILVSDETITGFGRIGEYFASNRYGLIPDIIICGKGMTSGYFPVGAMIASERLYKPFSTGKASFLHGSTFGGNPAGAAVALANIKILEREDIIGNVQRNEDNFKATLDKLYDLEIVGDVRGAGYFYAIELVKNRETRETFNDAECDKLLRGYLSKALYANGLYCRADDRGDPVIQVAPPLICTQEHFDEIESILRKVLKGAMNIMGTK